WHGLIADIPPGWAICDGENGTPNLVNRVALGTNIDGNVGAMGGNNTITLTPGQLPSHSHSGITESAGVHSHTNTTIFIQIPTVSGIGTDSGFAVANAAGGGSTIIEVGGSIAQNAGSHTHAFTT